MSRLFCISLIMFVFVFGCENSTENSTENRETTQKSVEVPTSFLTKFTYIGKNTFSCGDQTCIVEEYLHKPTDMEFVLLSCDGFMNEDNGKHQAKWNSFLIAKTEVTQGVWKKVMGTEPWKGKKHTKEGSDYPAVYVSWEDVQEFCRKTGLKLPTETQWEYACRAGTQTQYYWGDEVDGAYTWYKGNTWDADQKYAHKVQQKRPNAFGLYDMTGNVREWCQDRYKRRITKNEDPSLSTFRVCRGGSFRSSIEYFHIGCSPDARTDDTGFRVALPTLPVQELSTKESSCGRFIVSSSDVIKDRRTGLEWYVGQTNINWDDSKAWVESLSVDGGGWRMPTIYELERIYDPSKKNSSNLDPVFEIYRVLGIEVWSAPLQDSSACRFSFGINRTIYSSRSATGFGTRVFAVRASR